MFVVQRYSTVLRSRPVADGPPYGPTGVWSNIARCSTLKQALEAQERVLMPGMGRTLSPDRCRVRKVR